MIRIGPVAAICRFPFPQKRGERRGSAFESCFQPLRTKIPFSLLLSALSYRCVASVCLLATLMSWFSPFSLKETVTLVTSLSCQCQAALLVLILAQCMGLGVVLEAFRLFQLLIKSNTLQLNFVCIKQCKADQLLQQRTFVCPRSNTLDHNCSSSPNNRKRQDVLKKSSVIWGQGEWPGNTASQKLCFSNILSK